VGGKSFTFLRNPRRDVIDRETGERHGEVFDGYPSVLLRASRIGELTRQDLAALVKGAWQSRASARRAATWLSVCPPV